jgi:hypothetical protein
MKGMIHDSPEVCDMVWALDPKVDSYDESLHSFWPSATELIPSHVLHYCHDPFLSYCMISQQDDVW